MDASLATWNTNLLAFCQRTPVIPLKQQFYFSAQRKSGILRRCNIQNLWQSYPSYVNNNVSWTHTVFTTILLIDDGIFFILWQSFDFKWFHSFHFIRAHNYKQLALVLPNKRLPIEIACRTKWRRHNLEQTCTILNASVLCSYHCWELCTL